MAEKQDVAEVVPAPAEAPATPTAPELVETPVETEDSFVDESLGYSQDAETEESSEEEKKTSPNPEAPTVAPPEEQKEEAPAEPEKPEEPKAETPEVHKAPEVPTEPVAKTSRLDRRLAEKYVENLILKGAEVPSSQDIEAELASMSLEEKKTALRNLLDENRSIRGQKPEPLSNEDEEAIIEAEVERRYQEEQAAIRAREWNEDLVATLAAHPELDKRTDKYNPALEKAVIPLVESGMLTSEAYALVQETIQAAQEEARKKIEIESQKSMSGSVVAPSVPEPIIRNPVTDEDKFLADAGV